jgi:hypothetical protein
MSRFRNLGKPFAAAAVLFAAMDVSSLTLGPLEGVAVLGRPLDVSVTVRPGPTGDAAVACLDATVSYGDTRQPAASVSLGVDPWPDQTLLVNVYVHASVSEPVVTLELHAGCGTKISRQYILFADPAGAAPWVASPSAVASAPVVTPTRESAAGALTPSPAASEAKRQWSQTTPQPPIVAPPKGSSLSPASPAATKPRPAVAANAAATSPPDSVREPQRSSDPPPQPKQESLGAAQASSPPLQALEADLKALQVANAKNQQNLERLSGSIATSESPSHTVLLIAAAACALAVAALLAFRRSRARANSARWWDAAQGHPLAHQNMPSTAPADDTAAVAAAASGSAAKGAAEPVAALNPGAQHDASSVVEVDIVLGDSDFQDLAESAPPVKQSPTVASSPKSGPLGHGDVAPMDARLAKVREMPDVRQEAEFFVALGQHEEATKVLEASIKSSTESIPSVYLDLLTLLHTLSRREEFDRYRGQFQQQFTGLLPEYSNFLAEGNDLEAYAEICSQIKDLWPSSDAYAYIEACLIRQPEDQPGQGFDLQAFRDLLMLHGMLRHLGSVPDSQPAAFTTSERQDLRAQGIEPERDSQLNLTQPFPPLAQTQEPGQGGTDFDLTAPPNNLIEFDIGDLGIPNKSKEPDR